VEKKKGPKGKVKNVYNREGAPFRVRCWAIKSGGGKRITIEEHVEEKKSAEASSKSGIRA